MALERKALIGSRSGGYGVGSLFPWGSPRVCSLQGWTCMNLTCGCICKGLIWRSYEMLMLNAYISLAAVLRKTNFLNTCCTANWANLTYSVLSFQCQTPLQINIQRKLVANTCGCVLITNTPEQIILWDGELLLSVNLANLGLDVRSWKALPVCFFSCPLKVCVKCRSCFLSNFLMIIRIRSVFTAAVTHVLALRLWLG